MRCRARVCTVFLAAIGGWLSAACADFMGPEYPEVTWFRGIELRAVLEPTAESPTTRVRLSVITTNRTTHPITYRFWPACTVFARVYGEGVNAWEVPRSDCPLWGAGTITLAPRESRQIADTDIREFSLAEEIGTGFRSGTYAISALIRHFSVGEETLHDFEIHAGRIRAR